MPPSRPAAIPPARTTMRLTSASHALILARIVVGLDSACAAISDKPFYVAFTSPCRKPRAYPSVGGIAGRIGGHSLRAGSLTRPRVGARYGDGAGDENGVREVSRAADACVGGVHLFLRVHLLPEVHNLDGCHLPQLQWRVGQASDPTARSRARGHEPPLISGN